eukprot:SAG31_NODE_4667_length_3052_cov_2.248899_3_plen_77_part_00
MAGEVVLSCGIHPDHLRLEFRVIPGGGLDANLEDDDEGAREMFNGAVAVGSLQIIALKFAGVSVFRKASQQTVNLV